MSRVRYIFAGSSLRHWVQIKFIKFKVEAATSE